VVATVAVTPDTDQAAVKATLDRYAIWWTVAVRP
jgi:hypothetical protein